jgi:hypothetical protein
MYLGKIELDLFMVIVNCIQQVALDWALSNLKPADVGYVMCDVKFFIEFHISHPPGI